MSHSWNIHHDNIMMHFLGLTDNHFFICKWAMHPNNVGRLGWFYFKSFILEAKNDLIALLKLN